jgi:hypothetical protein
MLATKEKAKERLDICNGCEYLRPFIKQCACCGCFVAAKVRMEYSQCPKEKW